MGRGDPLVGEVSGPPDYSHAGYRRGEAPLPDDLPVVANVRDFGATSDGETDDTGAFHQALESMDAGVLEIPPGRYVINDRLTIRKSGIVLRGAGADQTTLYFPKTLTDIDPRWSETTSGRRTSSYSWSGGFVDVRGTNAGGDPGVSVGDAKRGVFSLTVDAAGVFEPGMEVVLTVYDDEANSLTRHAYAGDPGNIDNIGSQVRLTQVFRIEKAGGGHIVLDRPLRFDVRQAWRPALRFYEPTVTEVGIERLALEFPADPYRGHFTELGHNGIVMQNVSHSWIRDVDIHNAESGIFLGGRFNTIKDVRFYSRRQPDIRNHTGHHGVTLGGQDNLFTGFDFQTRFIHDITVSRGSIGNVSSGGRGVDVNFDHHRRAPYENLFTDIDLGKGSRVWRSGGGRNLGKHSAARGTFWNLRARRPLGLPPSGFAPAMINLVALESGDAESIGGLVQTAGQELLGLSPRKPRTVPGEGLWLEVVPNDRLEPADIHMAQLQRRLAGEWPLSNQSPEAAD